jgi:hypothetical protein
VHGFIGRIGEHTVTGIWQAARLAGVVHHSRAHDFFARRRWSPDELGLTLAGFIVARFVGDEAAIRVAVDDTLFARSGPKVFAAGWHFDPEVRIGRRLRRGNTFVCLGILVALPALGARVICLPVLFRLWRPGAERTDPKTRPELAAELVDRIAGRFAGRRIELYADAYYANRKLAVLPENVSACVRVRSNAALYAPPPRRNGKPGRPRKRGERLGSPAEIGADPRTRWRSVEIRRASGERERVEATTVDCLWYSVLGDRPLRVVICRDPIRRERPELYVLSTDPSLSAAEILSRYLERWAIEVAFQDAKGQLGVGEARNRVEPAVERTVPFGFLCHTITLCWYALHGDAAGDVGRRRLAAPWYRQKRSPAFADMLVALRRELIGAEFRQGTPAQRSHGEIERLGLTPAQPAA